ncbi:MAG: hypothetical protein ACOX9R_04220 [Armatimonadota bacterium]|jgi:capsular polysaccharide biosynthesis protein
MEFIEYYRIIRRRIWIAIVIAALTSAVVVVARLLPEEVVYPATGRVLVHETAQRQTRLRGNEVIIGSAEDDQRFWQDLNQFLGSRFVMEAAAREMGIPLGEALGQLQPPRAERIQGSSAALIYVAATGVPAQTFDPNVSNARDVALRYCDAVMATLADVWRQRRAADLERVRFTLNQREPILQSEIAQIQRRTDELAREYGGVTPTGVLDRLTSELALVEQQIVNTEMARGTAEARSEALAGQAGRLPEAAPMEVAAVDPRVQSLRQTILERQIELDEQLTRRTAEHEEVKALEATIERLKERLRELEASTASREISPQASTILLQTTINANVEAAAVSRQLELLQSRAGEIRGRLPDVRADARVFEDVAARLTSAQASYNTLLDSLDRIEAEEDLLEQTPLFEVLSEAEPRHVARGLGAFLVRLVAAAAGGLALGVLLIFVLHYVDFSFQDEQEAERMLGVPVLAGIPRSDIPPTGRSAASEETPATGSGSDEGIF